MADKCDCKKGSPAWLNTYGDMVTLLLCFFIMLFTVAKIDGRDFRLILSAFKGSLGLFDGGQTLSKGRLEEMGMTVESLPSQEKGRALSKAMKIATEVFQPEVKTNRVRLTQDERGLVVSLIGEDYFAPGSARLTEELRKTLVKVAGLLRQTDSPVRVEGHADESSLKGTPAGERYETNWELASQRSINVLRYLHEREDVEPSKMSSVSFGRYRPLSASDTPEGRSLNRRIDIIILSGKTASRDYEDADLPGPKVPGTEWTTE